MGDQKISQLTALTDPSYADLLPIVHSGVTMSVTPGNLDTVINVKRYGAVGDGTADDTAALIAAIAAGAGRVVYIPQGTYLVSSQLALPTKTILAGAGIGITTLKQYASTTISTFVDTSAANVTVKDLTLDGNAGNATTTNGMTNAGGANYTLQRVEIKNSNGSGVIVNADNARLLDCVITGTGNPTTGGQFGVWHDAAAATNLYISRCRFSDWRLNAIFAGGTAGAGVRILDCVFSGNHRQVVPSGGGQICLSAAGGYVIDGNHFILGGGAGSASTSGIEGGTCIGVVCAGNYFDGGGVHAWGVIHNGTGWTISGNKIYNYTTAGIQLGANCDNVAISGNCLSANGTDIVDASAFTANILIGSDNTYTTLSGDYHVAAVRLAAIPGNALLNGGFGFAQRQAPATDTTIADNGLGPDRWKSSRENAEVQYSRQDGMAETGITSRYFGRYTKITNTGKVLVRQIVEGINSAPLRGRTVIFQIKMKASVAKTIRMAVLELQAAGTMDSVPALVAAWGANTVDPTWGTNVAVITAAQSKSVTTAWQLFSVSVTVPATSKNLIVAIWTDSQFAAADTLSIAEAGLYDGASARAWLPRPVAEELALCQRYFEKTYDIDTAPGTVTTTNMLVNGAMTAWILYQPTCAFMVVKRASPTIAIYNSQDGTVAQCSEYDAGSTFIANRAASAANYGTHTIGMGATSGTFTGNNFERWHFTASAEL